VGARLGQHFLFDPAILGRIADAALIGPGDHVMEIGPGQGPLTRELARRAARVTAIETDARLATALATQFAGSNVTIVHADALKIDWPRVDVIVCNIPYQITSPLIERALTPPRPKRVVFLMQLEVADRLAAQPGSDAYGSLSAGVQLVASVEKLFVVKAGSFRPPPKVQSAVVRLSPLASRLARSDAEETATRRLIQAAFQRRRQQIQRTLREAYGLTSERALAVLGTADIPPMERAERLSPGNFLTIARLLATT
jgi:16S rRNA (adenine1518-N6/adenine1519-N6)-dimethyltransferase